MQNPHFLYRQEKANKPILHLFLLLHSSLAWKENLSFHGEDSDVTPLEGPQVLKFQAPLPKLLHPPLVSVQSSMGTSGDGSKVTVRLFNNINIV